MNEFVQDIRRFVDFLDERRAIPFWILLFAVLATALQVAIPFPVDSDTPYHFAVGKLLSEHGILKSFPWTTFSWQFDHYADKEFLFHLLFVPLSGVDLITASRVVGISCGTAVLTAIFSILRSERVPLAGIWALLPLGSSAFVFRFVQVRPHMLSIILSVILLWSLARGRLKTVAVVAVLYPLSYVAFWQIPLILAATVVAAKIAYGERLSWRPFAVLSGGIAVGILLHPNTGNLLAMNWIHMTDILLRNAWGNRPGFQMGQEFDPYPLDQWFRYLLPAFLTSVAALRIAWQNRRDEYLPLAFAIASLIFWLLTMRSGRFSEYAIPFSISALALAIRTTNRSLIAPSLAGVFVACTLLFGTYPYRHIFAMETKTSYVEPEVVKTIQEHIPPGAQVFTCSWDYTGSLMLALPERKFMVALDPTLMYKRDPLLYELWYKTVFKPDIDAAEVIRTRFKSRYVVCLREPALEPLFSTLVSDPTVATYASDRWLFFDLEGTGVKVLR